MAKRGFQLSGSGVVAAVGFGLTLAWCMLTSHTGGFTSSAAGIEALVNPRFFYLLGIFLLAVAFMAAPRQLRRADRALRYAMPLLASFGTACFGLAYHQTLLDPRSLAICGLFVVGVSFFWFLARYVLMLARTQGFSCVVGALVIGIVVKLPVFSTFSFLVGPGWQVIAATVLPIACALVFEAACAMARRDAETAAVGDGAGSGARLVFGVPAKPRPATPTSRTFRRNMLILVAVSAILLAVIRSVSDLGLWGSVHASATLGSALLEGFAIPAVCLLAFAFFTLVRTADLALAMRFQPAMLLVMAGLFVVAFQASPENASLSFLSDIIQVDELCAHLLFWTVTVTALDALDMPSYRVIGIAEAVFAGASIAWMLLLGTSAIASNAYVLLATYVVVIGAMYATWLGGRRRSDVEGDACGDQDPACAGASDGFGQASADSSLAKTVTDTCLEMARLYKLSPRETEVFTLLAQGRTRAFIQDELVLSGSTVKTHVNHIYAKMDVHDRQEMMDLIWS